MNDEASKQLTDARFKRLVSVQRTTFEEMLAGLKTAYQKVSRTHLRSWSRLYTSSKVLLTRDLPTGYMIMGVRPPSPQMSLFYHPDAVRHTGSSGISVYSGSHQHRRLNTLARRQRMVITGVDRSVAAAFGTGPTGGMCDPEFVSIGYGGGSTDCSA